MNVLETFPKEGKQNLINIKKCITNLHRNFTSEYHHYLLLTSVFPARLAFLGVFRRKEHFISFVTELLNENKMN